MKVNEASSLVRLIRETSLFDLMLVSLIVLPIYLSSWNFLLKQFDEALWQMETEILLGLVALYFVALFLMKFGQSKEDKQRIALHKIMSYYKARGWTRMSFERIQGSIDERFDQTFLEALVNQFPTEITTGKIKGGKKGIVVLGQEDKE